MPGSLNCQAELVFVTPGLAFVPGTPIVRDPAQRDMVIFKKRKKRVVEDICGGKRMLGPIELREGHPLMVAIKICW